MEKSSFFSEGRNLASFDCCSLLSVEVGDKRAKAPGASLQGQFTMEQDPLMLSWNGVKQVDTLSLTENF